MIQDAAHLPETLREALTEALNVLRARCPERAADIGHVERSAENPSSVRLIARRLEALVEKCLGADGTLTPEEKRVLGDALIEAKAVEGKGKTGPKSRGFTARMMIYITPEMEDRVQAACDREQIPMAELVRRALAAYLKEEKK